MRGGYDDDTIFQNDGNCRLNVGNGNDLNFGGTGDVVFTPHAAEGSVTILDFGADDAADSVDVGRLGSTFETPEDLKATLSYVMVGPT